MARIFFSLLIATLLLTLPVGHSAKTATAEDSSVTSTAQAGIRIFNHLQTKRNESAEIESYASGLDRYVKRNAQRARYFANLASYENNEPARWQEFRNRSTLDKAWKDGKTYTSANVWFNPNGDLTVAMFTLSSPSGDWAQYVTNYYRSDGSLAKLHSELRTFMGDLIVIRDRFYNANGKQLKEQTRYLDLTTRKPRKVKQDDFADQDVPLYAKTSALPFYNLLKRR